MMSLISQSQSASAISGLHYAYVYDRKYRTKPHGILLYRRRQGESSVNLTNCCEEYEAATGLIWRGDAERGGCEAKDEVVGSFTPPLTKEDRRGMEGGCEKHTNWTECWNGGVCAGWF